MRIAAILVVLLISLVVHAAEPPAASFGDSVQGLSVALLPKGREGKGGDADGQITILVRNENPTPLKLQGAFAWLLLVESREVAFYTDRIPLDAAQKELAPAGELRCPVQVRQLQAHPYQKGTKVVDGYPQAAETDASARAAGDILVTPLKAQAIAFVPAGGQKITVRSKATTLSLARLASTQPDDLAALLERFRRDAFAARDASELAAARGAGDARVIPALLEGLRDPAMPDYGRMWIAAALTRIGSEQAAAAVVGLVDDPREGVRDVIAFHGPTMRQQSVDDAILRRARSKSDPLFTAWAARGFAEHGRPVPPGLVLAALESTEPRARAEVAEVLAGSADGADVVRLAKLFADGNELVRVAAADAVARHPQQPKPVIAAMVTALDLPGDSARARIVSALSKCAGEAAGAGEGAGHDWQYAADAPAEQNHRVLEEIRAWWRLQK